MNHKCSAVANLLLKVSGCRRNVASAMDWAQHAGHV